MIRLACIANAVYVTVLSTQQAALLYDIDFPHGELETSRLLSSLNSWLPLPAMNEERFLHGACTVDDDTLVVTGGLTYVSSRDTFNSVSICELLKFE